ncbi:DUF3558 domain-containing protein [Nocardia sp. NPDC051832]|uniref:DUF3558 domain-containing protein n=1 Tax=Nocardia sp. NPDC051832 TaxID=3155673 RepID=UPI0034317DE0
MRDRSQSRGLVGRASPAFTVWSAPNRAVGYDRRGVVTALVNPTAMPGQSQMISLEAGPSLPASLAGKIPSRAGGFMRVMAAVAGACALLVVTGCSSTVGGSGGPETSQAPTSAKLTKDQLWDPCSLPDSVIASTGADPATKDTNPIFSDREDWRLCQWTAERSDGRWGHFLLVSSTNKTLDDFRRNSYFRDFSDVTVKDRAGLKFYMGSRRPPTQCELAFNTTKGVISVNAGKYTDSETSTDPCTLATSAAEKIVDSIPR